MEDRDREIGRGEEDRRVRREVLALVLTEGSGHKIPAEVRARLGGREKVELAVEALIADDLLIRKGDKILPTPETIRFSELKLSAPPSASGARPR